MHKMFTLNDLYDFYNNQNKTCSFSSKESDSMIIVQIPEKMKFSDEYDPKFNLLPTHLMSCHLLENRNHSSISEDAMKEAIPSFYNRPILGYIQKIDDGDGSFHYDFAGHEMEFDDEGNVEYKETVVGVIPESCNPQLVYHEDKDKTYLEVDGYIYEDYTHAAEILRNKGECDVSVEISVDSLSFDSKSKVMLIDSFHFLGVCILGVTTDDSHQDILPGMEGANITISDFSAENNSFVFNKQNLIDEITTAVIKQLSDNKQADFSAEAKTTERREDVVMDNENLNVEFEETETEEVEEEVKVTETESVEVETTTTEEEETPVVIENESSDKKEEVEDNADETPEEVVEEEAETVEEFDEAAEEEEESDDEHQSVSAIEDEDSTETTRVNNSLNITLGSKTFELSLSDIQYSIESIVNEMYAEADNTYYSVIVYAESKRVVMIDVYGGRAYRQDYKDRKGVYSLVGSRVPVRSVWCTADEEAELDRIRSNYSAIESELNTYKAAELHKQREEVLSSEEYAPMAEFAEFAELKTNMDNYSVEELTKEADLLFAKFMKQNYSTFAAKETPKKQKMIFMSSGENKQEERLPYGGLFKNFKGNK